MVGAIFTNQPMVMKEKTVYIRGLWSPPLAHRSLSSDVLQRGVGLFPLTTEAKPNQSRKVLLKENINPAYSH